MVFDLSRLRAGLKGGRRRGAVNQKDGVAVTSGAPWGVRVEVRVERGT